MRRRGGTGRSRDGDGGAREIRATRLFVPGMGLLIAALGLILCASLARAEAGARLSAVHAVTPP